MCTPSPANTDETTTVHLFPSVNLYLLCRDFQGPLIMLPVGFGYFKCNIMYEYLLKQMSPGQGYMCLNCHNNMNNNTSMSQCTDTLSFINNKYIYSLSVVALFQKPNNFNRVC